MVGRVEMVGSLERVERVAGCRQLVDGEERAEMKVERVGGVLTSGWHD